MSEIDNPHSAAIRWDCPFCFARAGEPCHVKGRAMVDTPYLHSRRSAVLRTMLRAEFFRGREYERSAALRAAEPGQGRMAG